MKTEKLLRAEEAADMLSLRVSTIRRMILERQVPTVKIGRSVRIPQEAIEKIITNGWRESVSQSKAK